MSYFLKQKVFALAALATTLVFTSCSEDGDDQPTYNVPATYAFENVNYAGQTTRIAMLDALGTYIKNGNTGAVLDAQVMKNMYANVNAPFADAALNTSGKQLKDKTIEPAREIFEAYFDAVAAASQSSGAVASSGNAGILTSADNRTYLVDANGVELGQVIQKGLMGAVFYYQAVDGYLTPEKIGNGVDNTTITPGEGTTMEHHWDEAFGYFGAPTDFPTNLDNLKYWANYSNQVNAAINSNKTMMDAFIKGRAAISANDMATKEAAVAVIRTEWERLLAASAIHELNAAQNNMGDQAKKSHYLSEAMGFVMGLKYKTDRKLTDAQYNKVMAAIGTNLYNTTGIDVATAINTLSAVYGLDDVKSQL